MGFSAIGNLIDTVTRNITALESGGERLFQRGAWTYRLNTDRRDAVKQKLTSLLEETDKKARKLIEDHEDNSDKGGLLTAGVSFFYFEENNSI